MVKLLYIQQHYSGEEYERRKLAIIKKYDVKAAYLDPLLDDERRLKSELVVVQEQIAELQKL